MRNLRATRNIHALALLPGLFWAGGLETERALRSAGIQQFFAPPAMVQAWEKQRFSAEPLSEQVLSARIKLKTPGIDLQVQVASATRAPWVDANGWRVRREPGRDFWYDLPAGSAPLAAAEAFAYDAKAVLKITPADLEKYGRMLQFLRSLSERTLPDIVDFGFIDDGSQKNGEFLNLLSRRNLLYGLERSPGPKLRFSVAPDSENPYLFAAKIRDRLTDDRRSLRVFGSEVVLCRFVGNESEGRVHLLNYGSSPVDGIRLRVRGQYARGKLFAPEPAKPLEDYQILNGFTEFSVPQLGVYAVVDLTR